MTETELLNCNICLKNLNILKCDKCTFLSCSDCIVKWYNSQDENKCPQCKKINTFNIDYTKIVREHNIEQFHVLLPLIEMMISNLTSFGLGEEINDSFNDGKIFYPDNFIENFNNWPENIKQRFTYHPITQMIDDVEEIVAYKIREIYNNSESEEDIEDVD
jgi:hypothetical protein